ncbi:PHD transcription factor protein [Penicillium taxi]|uniref:PHD transcription factor protein n=1 Tax=Penicillium taxi TaxID=168475 RepID=UPI0025454A7F|nr:PHD transcription factor protein [Penicillium taxi]KAJ5899729.1 PHD transcription factor protein [Penicillium taxi]
MGPELGSAEEDIWIVGLGCPYRDKNDCVVSDPEPTAKALISDYAAENADTETTKNGLDWAVEVAEASSVTGQIVVDTTIVFVVKKVLLSEARQSVALEGQAVTVAIRVESTNEVVISTCKDWLLSEAPLLQPGTRASVAPDRDPSSQLHSSESASLIFKRKCFRAILIDRIWIYGRYFPASDDFRPDPKHANSVSEDSLKYWASVSDLCNPSNRIYEGLEGTLDVFALGSVIIKSSHLHARLQGRCASRDFSYADANEVKATALARTVLKDVKIPIIYFAWKINGRDVLVQERIPGVGLNVAWQYIFAAQKQLFKEEARDILRNLNIVKPPSSSTTRCYIVEDTDPEAHRVIQGLKYDIIFGEDNRDPDLSFMHNDFSLSNCIVNNEKIVELIDWEMAGYFGWKTAAQVYVKIRTPRRESFAALNLSEDALNDILLYNDLYEVLTAK